MWKSYYTFISFAKVLFEQSLHAHSMKFSRTARGMSVSLRIPWYSFPPWRAIILSIVIFPAPLQRYSIYPQTYVDYSLFSSYTLFCCTFSRNMQPLKYRKLLSFKWIHSIYCVYHILFNSLPMDIEVIYTFSYSSMPQ